MQMSGTILGTINSRIRGFTARPLARNRAWAEERRRQTNIRALAMGKSPSSHLRRFMDNRKALREKNIENLQTIRKNEANMYVQQKIGGGYDGTKAQGTSGYLKPNKYTKIAKEASTTTLESEMRTRDTEHVLNEYEKYFVSKETRDRIKAAEAAKDEKKVESIRRRDSEIQRSARAEKAFIEYKRAMFTRENDEEADFNYMAAQFIDANNKYDPRDGKLSSFNYVYNWRVG